MPDHETSVEQILVRQISDILLNSPVNVRLELIADLVKSHPGSEQLLSMMFAIHMAGHNHGLTAATLNEQMQAANQSRLSMKRRKNTTACAKFETMWSLTSYLFTTRTRARVWTPVVEEMKVDLLEARRKHRTRTQRMWLNVCFVVRTGVLVLQTMRVSAPWALWLLIPVYLRSEIGHFFRYIWP